MIQKPHLRPFHLLLLCVAICAGQAHAITAADDINGSLEISPSAPTASWPDSGQSNQLAPNYTSTISVTVTEEEEIDGVNYTLTSGPTATTGCTDSNVIWTESNTTYSITNTAADTASATMTLTCTWSPDAVAGGGNGTAPADIQGQADADIQLLDSVVDWEFDSRFQMADGNEEIGFEVTITDYNGFGLEEWSLTEYTPANATPANPDWEILPAAIPAGGSAWLLSASAVSEIASKGNVKIKYNDGSEEERNSYYEIVFYEIETETAALIPVDRKRKRLGVGEKVNITVIPESDGGITWTTSEAEDSVLNTDENNKPYLIAASSECGPKVKADFGDGVSHSIQFQVVEPSGEFVVFEKRDLSIEELEIAAQEQGVGMELDIKVMPDDVSFANVEVKELPGPAVNKLGYFLEAPVNTDHKPSTILKRLSLSNRYPDFAGFTEMPKIMHQNVLQWIPGSCEWSIRFRWKVIDKAEQNFPNNITQNFELIGNSGASKVTKFVPSAVRTPTP